MAQGLFNSMYSDSTAYSAGVDQGSTTKKGEALPDDITACLEEVGIDSSTQHRKPLTPALVFLASKVFVLCSRELCPEYLLESRKATYLEVKDPKHSGMDAKRETRDYIKSLIETIDLS